MLGISLCSNVNVPLTLANVATPSQRIQPQIITDSLLFDGAHTKSGMSFSSIFCQIYTRLLLPVSILHTLLNIKFFQLLSTVQCFSLQQETHLTIIFYFSTRLLHPISNISFFLTVFEQKVETFASFVPLVISTSVSLFYFL